MRFACFSDAVKERLQWEMDSHTVDGSMISALTFVGDVNTLDAPKEDFWQTDFAALP